jgi:hypothetical protein
MTMEVFFNVVIVMPLDGLGLRQLKGSGKARGLIAQIAQTKRFTMLESFKLDSLFVGAVFVISV